ncbi:MerR family transcriptional regulator [Asanoa ishikariensis]|uniref:DNA-binding transcriptional regulator, MerR family n=1 Tax=Asanoa ishikariensis TaxID=137265 RepID=A0A1H3T7X1_9ACTN|nr:TioE family transcriptional regulator [Asanoa ishikariensis]GIF62922.1 MerR family transcriptional regulator [Asanoa ishikariensis]SDZ45951.1 DNA-binding transcriptional regulator, MerR family [Asanoa ishikariensis]
MREKLQRPVDLARQHGRSTQAIRNYEAAGILPETDRTPSGYRTYTPTHATALAAYLALVPGHGNQTATSIMRAINGYATADALALIDESHAQLLEDRRTLRAVETALRDLEPVPAERGDTFVGPLSRRLGIRPATLRKWEDAGLVQPRRDPRTSYRIYGAADVRDALLTHQLRRGGYLLEQISPVIAQVRSAGGVAPLESMLRDWRARLDARGRAMLTGAAALDAYLACRSAESSATRGDGTEGRTSSSRQTGRTSGSSVTAR